MAVHFIINIGGVLLFGNQFAEDAYYRFGLAPADFWSGAWWQPLTALFLHGGANSGLFGIMHLTVNMLALWSLGVPVEKTVGSGRFASLYFVSGAVSSLLVVLGYLFETNAGNGITVGASGAVLGVLGALAIFYPNSMVLVFFIPMKIRTAAISFGLLSILAEIFGFFPIISHLGHLGGLIGGVLYTKFVLSQDVEFSDRGFRKKDRGEHGRIRINIRRGSPPPIDPYAGGEIPKEREINPVPEERDREEREKKREEPSGETDSNRKLYYDPQTGKFYIE
jgi:membrane associated rhomboid family serine protease